MQVVQPSVPGEPRPPPPCILNCWAWLCMVGMVLEMS